MRHTSHIACQIFYILLTHACTHDIPQSQDTRRTKQCQLPAARMLSGAVRPRKYMAYSLHVQHPFPYEMEGRKKAAHRNVESKFAPPFFSIECPVSHQIDMDSRIRAAAAVTGFLD